MHQTNFKVALKIISLQFVHKKVGENQSGELQTQIVTLALKLNLCYGTTIIFFSSLILFPSEQTLPPYHLMAHAAAATTAFSLTTLVRADMKHLVNTREKGGTGKPGSVSPWYWICLKSMLGHSRAQ